MKKNATIKNVFDDESPYVLFLILVLLVLSDEAALSRQIGFITKRIDDVNNATSALTNTVHALAQASRSTLGSL